MRVLVPSLCLYVGLFVAPGVADTGQSDQTAVRLTQSNGAMNGNASVGPDGRIGFVSNRTGSWQVWVMAADGANVRQLTSGPGVLGYASWTNDGRSLLFHREVEGRWRLYSVVVSTGSVSEIPFTDTAIVHRLRPTMLRDGRLLFDRRVGSDDPRWFAIASAAANGTNERLLTTTRRYHSDARQSPDGRRIAWQVGQGDNVSALHYQIFVMNADGSGATALTSGADSSKYPKWSPDGRRLTYTVESRTNPTSRDVWVMNADGSNKQQITTRAGIDFDASWSADGRSLIYTTDQFGGRELVRLPIPPR